MKKLLLDYISKGEEASGWRIAAYYQGLHPDWMKESGIGKSPNKYLDMAKQLGEAYQKYEQLELKICSLLHGIDSLEDLERYLAAGWHLEPPENDGIVKMIRKLAEKEGL